MSIIVDDKPIEVKLRYIDKSFTGGAVGVTVFQTEEDEEKWVEKESKKRNEKAMELRALNKDVPKELEEDPKVQIKELVTFWKRMDWGTQTQIINDSQKTNNIGESSTDWSKYRLSQMKNLMVGWDLKTKDGKPIPVNEKILKRLDFSIAISLIQKYEEVISPDEDELENLE
jgi:hypothetical protein